MAAAANAGVSASASHIPPRDTPQLQQQRAMASGFRTYFAAAVSKVDLKVQVRIDPYEQSRHFSALLTVCSFGLMRANQEVFSAASSLIVNPNTTSPAQPPMRAGPTGPVPVQSGPKDEATFALQTKLFDFDSSLEALQMQLVHLHYLVE